MNSLVLLLCAFLGAGFGPGAQEPRPLDARGLRAMIAGDSGKVVVLNVWASWCKPCREEMPALVALRAKYQKEGLRLILLSADDAELGPTDVRRALDSAGVDFETYITADSSEEAFINGVSPEWGGALPLTIVYGRDGKRLSMSLGGKRSAQFEEAVLPALRKRP